MAWTEDIYQSRIADAGSRRRHAAGSPTPEEIATYLSACEGATEGHTAVIMGMTPELRIMAARNFRKVIAVDSSRTAIGMLGPWMPEELRHKETIIEASWLELAEHVVEPVAVVFGDGISANLTDSAGTRRMLEILRGMLSPGGRCVMRNVVLMDDIAPRDFCFPRLLEDYRAGRIDGAEFGFTVRMLGFYDTAYTQETGILDNARLYAETDAMLRDGLINEDEAAMIGRYRFEGLNYIPSEPMWRADLEASGFSAPLNLPSDGKLWQRYYPVQAFSPV